jgi:hypothetical protein
MLFGFDAFGLGLGPVVRGLLLQPAVGNGGLTEDTDGAGHGADLVGPADEGNFTGRIAIGEITHGPGDAADRGGDALDHEHDGQKRTDEGDGGEDIIELGSRAHQLLIFRRRGCRSILAVGHQLADDLLDRVADIAHGTKIHLGFLVAAGAGIVEDRLAHLVVGGDLVLQLVDRLCGLLVSGSRGISVEKSVQVRIGGRDLLFGSGLGVLVGSEHMGRIGFAQLAGGDHEILGNRNARQPGLGNRAAVGVDRFHGLGRCPGNDGREGCKPADRANKRGADSRTPECQSFHVSTRYTAAYL